METMIVKPEDIEKIVKRACYLAWQASQVYGMGFLQDRGEQSEDKVFENIVTDGDYPIRGQVAEQGGVFADYVFGRMMKLSIRCNRSNGELEFKDGRVSLDYQSWGVKYPTYKDLINAAIDSLARV